MRYAVVVDGTVVNVILWDSEAPLSVEGELVACGDEPVDIGWGYDGTEWDAPPPVIAPGPEEAL